MDTREVVKEKFKKLPQISLLPPLLRLEVAEVAANSSSYIAGQVIFQ